MSKYIDADDYKELIEREKAEVNLIGYKFEDGCKIGLGIAIEVIDEMPSANVVEVVRCKDCRWWHEINNSLFGYCFARRYNDYAENWKIGMYRYYTRRCKGDFYCADGERREIE